MGQSKPIRPTAIVVEDDDIQREMLTMLLEDNNFDVLQCEDAETAALAVKARHPSLIVTDISLVGKMNGVDLAHFAQQQNAGVRIVVISGRPLPRPLPPGARFITKPVFPTALLAETAQ
ncbi:response regulator [Bradyrhizobium guangdongense]|uniref:Response regulator n=1 Tax=Bradyrhizobium guangdongense TaxID=1325090 RepID=A0A410VBA0_9BRAD|nr:response regulator [Bradyrhizobium guangdongense]QAU40981.1 response regulator [Bradyrhizobium guangdongense]QOZ62041.1 response regulator [Bradyrhizobium guangdongense]GGI21276.1 response regulator [Bradyrhizobium guangdongense]